MWLTAWSSRAGWTGTTQLRRRNSAWETCGPA